MKHIDPFNRKGRFRVCLIAHPYLLLVGFTGFMAFPYMTSGKSMKYP